MRMVMLLAAAAMSAAAMSRATSPAAAQTSRQFRDWLVACDNLRTCSAFGFESQDDPSGSYVRVTRSGEASAQPAVGFHFDVGDGVKNPGVRLSLVGQAAGGVPSGPLPGPHGEVALNESQAANFLSALPTAVRLKLSLLDGTTMVGSSDVSLSGATAALRFIDDQQKRAGGTSALVAKGPAPSSAMPPVPPLPVIAAQPISQIAAPLPKPPDGIHPSQDCLSGPGADAALIAFRLSSGLTLWGACEDWGAYNADYRFFITRQAKTGQSNITPLTISGFDIPGQAPRPDSRGLLTWPVLAADKTVITSITKDEGLGDCGVASDWVWDGHALRQLELRAMPVCRGVDSGHWPLLFKAVRK